MRMVHFGLALGALALLAAASVRREAAAAGGGQGAALSGRVRFTGTPPANARIDMSEEPQCKAKYPTPPTQETVMVGQGGLANVFVYVKSGLPAGQRYPAPTTPVTLDQEGCRYHPHVFGIRVGQQLAIENSDPLMHNIKSRGTRNRPFNISQSNVTATPTMRTFAAPEVMVALECNVHGWMKAFVGVLDHPFFGVTGPDGSYKIAGLPPGTYTIEAWHERYGTQTATVTVPATGTKTQDFTYPAAAGGR